MSDIVERLRAYEAGDGTRDAGVMHADWLAACHDAQEAADTIVRLTAERDEARAERDRLRGVDEEACADAQLIIALEEENDALRAENGELRRALRRVSAEGCEHSAQLANAALRTGGKGDE